MVGKWRLAIPLLDRREVTVVRIERSSRLDRRPVKGELVVGDMRRRSWEDEDWGSGSATVGDMHER